MTPDLAVGVALLIPLAVSLSVALLGSWGRSPDVRDGWMVVGATVLPALVLTVIAPAVGAGERPALRLFDMMPGVPLAFEVEPLGLIFAMVASVLWPVTALYAVGYLRGHHEQHQTRFLVFFSGSITAALGVAFAANLLTLFLFYEVLTLSTYPLVTHHQDDKARAAGRVYLGILLSTSVGLLLPAILWTWSAAGTVTFTPGGLLQDAVSEPWLPVLLGMYAFGIGKAALMPFHRWLPNAMVAPTPVSALLHAVAVVKAGVFSVLKIVVYVFGLDLLQGSGASVWLMYVAAYTILAASLVALTRTNLKERLAYSTIGQLGYIVLGAMIATPAAVVGGGLHIVMHAFGKITLFFCAGAIAVVAHRKDIRDMVGLGRLMPWTFGAFAVGALSVIGVPPGGGAWSKWWLALGALGAEQPVLVVVLMMSSLLNVLYLMDIVGRGVFFAPAEELVGEVVERDHPLTWIPPVITAAGCVALFLWGGPLTTILHGALEVP